MNARLVLRDTQNIDNAKDKIRNKEGNRNTEVKIIMSSCDDI